MAPLLLAAVLVLLPVAASGTSERGAHVAGTHLTSGPPLAPGASRAHRAPSRKRSKARPNRKRRRAHPGKAIADVSGALPGSLLTFGTGLDLRSACNRDPDCSSGLHPRIFGEREVEGLVRAADGLYTGAVVRDRVGFWIWARPSAERLTLSPIVKPGDQQYGLSITGCFE